MKKSGLLKANKDTREHQLNEHFGHSHSHVHASDLPLAIGLNLGFSIAEFFFRDVSGFRSNFSRCNP